MAKRKGLEEGKEKDEVKEWSEFEDLKTLEFDSLARQYREAHLAETTAKAIKKKLAPDIEAAMLVVGQRSIKVGNLTAIQANGRTPKILSATALLEAGVDAETVAECTLPGTPYTYIQVKAEGEKED